MDRGVGIFSGEGKDGTTYRVFLALIGGVILQFIVLLLIFGKSIADLTGGDFIAFYDAGLRLRAGQPLYIESTLPYLNPPFFAWLMIPFTDLPLLVGRVIMSPTVHSIDISADFLMVPFGYTRYLALPIVPWVLINNRTNGNVRFLRGGRGWHLWGSLDHRSHRIALKDVARGKA